MGISILNDINRDDLLYISINPSKYIWTEKHQYKIKPLSCFLNNYLEEHYKTYLKHQHGHHSFRKQVIENKYKIDKNRVRLYRSFLNQILYDDIDGIL